MSASAWRRSSRLTKTLGKGSFSTSLGHDLLTNYDFVVDATDNFEARLAIAESCSKHVVPYSHAGILGFTGQTMTVLPGRSVCYRCIFTDAPPDNPTPRGPIGPLPGVLGSIQATEALKYLVGCGELLTDRLLVYDALSLAFRTVTLRRNPDCPLCGDLPR